VRAVDVFPCRTSVMETAIALTLAMNSTVASQPLHPVIHSLRFSRATLCYSAVLAMALSVRPSVRHKSVFYQIG